VNKKKGQYPRPQTFRQQQNTAQFSSGQIVFNAAFGGRLDDWHNVANVYTPQ
jgi:hypothetical protein